MLGDVRGQDHVQAADRGRGVQDRYNRFDQLPAQHTDQTLQEQPVPGDMRTGTKPGQARAGRHLRPDNRVAGYVLRKPVAGHGSGVDDHHVLHQEVHVHRQLQPGPKGVQSVPHAHYDHVHVARVVRGVRGHVADDHVEDNAVSVLRAVQGAAVRLEGGDGLCAHHAPMGSGRLRDTDQCQLCALIGVHAAVRGLLLSHRDEIQQEDDRGPAQAARPRRTRQTVPVEPTERVHQATGQTA